MKKYNIQYVWLLAGLLVSAFAFNACEDKEDEGSNTPMVIANVFLENAQSTVPDREVTFARLGQIIRLEGSGFNGVVKVLINGKSCYFNPVFVTDNSMMVQISADVPTIDASEDVRNTIRLEKSASNFLVYDFEIRAAAPSITGVSHTLPAAGDLIMIYGKGLQEIASITFPGNVVVTEGINTNEDGTEVTVTVPEGLTESGSLLVIGANGGAYSPAYFNFKAGLVHNFDDVQNYSWGSGIDNTALTGVIPTTGDSRSKSQGGYQVFNANGDATANYSQKFWLNSTNAMTIMENIPASTSTTDCGIQMDIYVEGAWNSGIIRFVMADGWGNSRYCMLYQPVYVNSAYNAEAFVNPGCWFTITLPFASSVDFEGKTLGDVIEQMSKASYKQAGPIFENSGIADVFDPVSATEKIYFDNIRVVPLTTPAYSDFPDED